MKTRCTATKADATQCKAWAVPGSNPALCAAHGGAGKKPGAPAGNRNAEKHGFYSRQAPLAVVTPATGPTLIDDFAARYAALSAYFDALLLQETDPDALKGLFNVLGQGFSRIFRAMRDQRAISGEAADGIANAIAMALDELSTELGTDLR